MMTIAAIAGMWTSTASAQDNQALAMEGKGIIKAFATELTTELKAGLKAGGPTEAISVCNTSALPITAAHTAQSGWTVKRSSHKLRNPSNAPDAFEARAISEFQARQAKGEKAKDMMMAMTTVEDGQTMFRMVKAIPTGKPCVTCHGTDINPDVITKLDSLYPSDTARGFNMGEMRGIFSLKNKL